MNAQYWNNLQSKNQGHIPFEWCSELDQAEFPWPWDKSDWLNLNKTSRKYLLVWIENEALALWELDNHPHAYLLKFMTKKISWRKGHGSQLLNQSVNLLKSLGFDDAMLDVQVDNERGFNFYIKHLWQVSRRVRAFYADGQDSYSMFLKF